MAASVVFAIKMPQVYYEIAPKTFNNNFKLRDNPFVIYLQWH